MPPERKLSSWITASSLLEPLVPIIRKLCPIKAVAQDYKGGRSSLTRACVAFWDQTQILVPLLWYSPVSLSCEASALYFLPLTWKK